MLFFMKFVLSIRLWCSGMLVWMFFIIIFDRVMCMWVMVCLCVVLYVMSLLIIEL